MSLVLERYTERRGQRAAGFLRRPGGAIALGLPGRATSRSGS
jgi:hypothetical protein